MAAKFGGFSIIVRRKAEHAAMNEMSRPQARERGTYPTRAL